MFASYSNAQITLEAVVKNDILIAQTSYNGLALKQDGEDSTYYIRFDQSGAIPYIRDSDPEKYNYYPFKLYLGKTKEIAINTFAQLIKLTEILKENEKILFKDCNNQQFIIYRVQATGNKKGNYIFLGTISYRNVIIVISFGPFQVLQSDFDTFPKWGNIGLLGYIYLYPTYLFCSKFQIFLYMYNVASFVGFSIHLD